MVQLFKRCGRGVSGWRDNAAKDALTSVAMALCCLDGMDLMNNVFPNRKRIM